MRRVLLLLPLLALAGCKKETPQGAVKVTVTYEGFKPGCVRVLARDAGGKGEALSDDVEGQGGPTGGSLIVAVLPREDWGNTIDLEAQAFERTCTGTPVVSKPQRVTVVAGQVTPATLQLLATDQDQDGYVSILTGGSDCNDDAAAVHPGVTEERCNGVDDNCNGQADREELQLGQACTEGNSCQGTRQCGDNGRVQCTVVNAVLAYPDGDGDGHGDRSKPAEAFCNGVPTGYVTGLHDDCDDTRNTVYTGALESCDGLDNDCDEARDEDFSQVGMMCTDSASQCSGRQQCNTAGTGLTCVATDPVPSWYPDADGDGYGSGTAVPGCVSPGAGYASQGGDCDEGNPFRHPNRMEACDGLDNDCDNLPEAAAVCTMGPPAWTQQTLGTSSQEWRSVFTVVPGGVGIVGNNNARASLTPGSNTFQMITVGCAESTTAWNALWVDAANDGRGHFGSSGGRLSYQDRTSPTCVQMHATGFAVEGLVGIRNGTNLEIHGVTSSSSTSGEGQTFIWNGGDIQTPGTARVGLLYDIHGVSRTALFAVGSYTPFLAPTESRIYRFNHSSGQWQRDENLPASSARLNGVWVVNEKVAFAVGESSTVLRWDGEDWTRMPFPNTYVESLTSVVAFGANLAYATAFNGRIYRYDGQQWAQVFEDTSLRFNDIAGTSPADLWVVGNNGVVLHWPQ
ncbi:MopE-related protein [Pyxidicoccus sp. 3LFB2]